MITKESKAFFCIVWIIWFIVVGIIWGLDWLPNEIKVYSESGYTGVSIPGPLQILLILFIAGWPIFGWVILDK